MNDQMICTYTINRGYDCDISCKHHNVEEFDESFDGLVMLISGYTHTGKAFRPSDWSARIAEMYADEIGKVVRYSKDIQPVMFRGRPAVAIFTEDFDFSFILKFATDNDLVVYTREL